MPGLSSELLDAEARMSRHDSRASRNSQRSTRARGLSPYRGLDLWDPGPEVDLIQVDSYPGSTPPISNRQYFEAYVQRQPSLIDLDGPPLPHYTLATDLARPSGSSRPRAGSRASSRARQSGPSLSAEPSQLPDTSMIYPS
ncbi:hypothetical protein LTS18_006153, partial [Coniosporium uncinatum]